MLSPRLLLTLAPLGLGLGLAACVTDAVTGKRRYAPVQWDVAEELELGRESAPNVESQFDAAYPDPLVNEELGKIVAQLVALSPRKDDFEFRFEVLNSSIPNAFALPGGLVYITRGLLQELETEAEFIAVLGHELGHVEHRHSMLNQSKGAVTGLITRPLGAVARRLPIGGRIVGAAAGVVAAPSVLFGLKFSREQELEADQRGVYFCAELGYDPREFMRVFELFERMEQESGGGSEFSILRTHPLNKNRVEGIEKTLEDDYPELAQRDNASFRRSSPRFAEILEGFHTRKEAYAFYDRALSRVGDQPEDIDQDILEAAKADLHAARTLVPDEPLFQLFEGELALAAEDYEGALQHFVEAHAIYERRTPGKGHWKVPFFLGAMALEAGQVKDAIEYLVMAEARFPLNGMISFALGRANEAKGDAEAARAAYERAEQHLPGDSPLKKEARRRRKELR